MNQVPLIRRLLFILLVSILETHTKSVADGIYIPRGANYSLNSNSSIIVNDTESDSSVNILSTKPTTVSQQEDQDPIQPSDTIVYNRFKNPPDNDERYSSSDEDPKGPPDHVIPYSEHEAPREVATKPRYTAPGQWARPTKPRDVSSEDVPSKLYAQVRRTHTVRRLPRRKAVENAESEEEKENASRLREVVRNSKVNTVYTEEGYEDSAYDHAGQIRDADYHEGYAKKLQEQLDTRKKTADDQGNDGKADSSNPRKHKNVDPEEFKDYDEDYREYYETTTDRGRSGDDSEEEGKWTNNAYPKSVAQNGARRLEEDLEREAMEIERGVEISKLVKDRASGDSENFTDSPSDDGYRSKQDKKGRRHSKRKRPTSTRVDDPEDNGGVEGSHDLKNESVYVQDSTTSRTPGDEEGISTDRAMHETTTVINYNDNLLNRPSESYRYEVEGNSPTQTEVIDFQRTDANPATISYSQLFWDYFKAKQNQVTTMDPFIVESTTFSPNLLQSSSIVGNGFVPHSIYGEQLTTSFPIVESAILNPQKLVSSQTLINPQYSLNNGQNQLAALEGSNPEEQWQAITINEPPLTEQNQYSELYDNSAFISDSERNLDSKEEPNIANAFSNPTVTSFVNRKPRYKITMRHKQKKPEESSTSNLIKEASIETTTTGTSVLSSNYMKVLKYLMNENTAKNHLPKPIPKNNFHSSKNKAADLAAPLWQKEISYQNYIPSESVENTPLRGWNQFPGSHVPRHAIKKLRTSPNWLNSSPSNRKRSPKPATGLLPPLRGNDHTRQKETDDYLTRAGSGSKRIRTVPRAFRQMAIKFEPISWIQAKRRERRSPRRGDGDETQDGVVKAARSRANNATSNRGEIERAAKNPTAERNSRRKVTRGVEVGLVPDTFDSMVARSIGKKSRSRESDHEVGTHELLGEGSEFVVEGQRRSSGGSTEDGGENGKMRSGLENLEEDNDGKKLEIDQSVAKSTPTGNSEEDGRKQKEGFNGNEEEIGNVEGSLGSLKNNEEEKRIFNGKSVKLKRISREELLELNSSSREEKENLIITGMNYTNDEINLEFLEKNDDGKKKSRPKVQGDLRMKKEGINLNDEKRKGVDIGINLKYLMNEEVQKKGEIDQELVKSKININNTRAERNSDLEKVEEKHYADQKEGENENIEGTPKLEKKIDEIKEEETDEHSKKQKRHIQEDPSSIKRHEQLLNESSKLTEGVIDKEINAHFNDTEEEEEDGEKKVEVEVPEILDFDYVEETTEVANITTTEANETVDSDKYPFYNNEKLPTPSALRYAIDPQRVPRKTYGRMEFYNSRDSYKHCDEVRPNLEVLPNEEKPVPEKGANENPQRLKGLGDKLDCFKAKYFDDNPFDNPLFLEEEVGDPLPPLEVNSRQFASRIMLFPKEDDASVVQKLSRRPENHRRQRKPQATPTRIQQQPRLVRVKSYPRTVLATRPRVIRIKGTNTRYVKARKPQKTIRRPYSSASEIFPSYMPYQSQVYEDVMGTIKNMANSYQVEEITTVPNNEQAGVTEISEPKTNTSANSTKIGKKEKDRTLINSVEHQSNPGLNVDGLTPPRSQSNHQLNRHRTTYKRVKVPQRNKTRVQLVQRTANGLRPINYRQKIIRYKRDARIEDDIKRFLQDSTEISSVDEGVDSRGIVEDKRESDGKRETVENLTNQSNSGEIGDPAEGNSTVSKTGETKRKSKVPKTVSRSLDTDGTEWKEKSPKMIYTIKDRIRYSKPKGEIRRTGKFTNETKVEENHRRKEPRYNYIKRRKPTNAVSSTTETSLLSSTDKISWTEPPVISTTNGNVEESSRELVKENKAVQYFVNNTDKEALNSSEMIDESNKGSIEPSNDGTSNKTENAYAVHEIIQEDGTTTQRSAEFSSLKAFLDTDPPGYTEYSSEEFKKSLFPDNNDTKNFDSSLNTTIPKESSEQDFSAPKQLHQSDFSDEVSSEKLETNTKIEPSKESSEEDSNSNENDSKDHGTFFNYWSRPSSPAENYEDERYTDLGPRVNKPSFYHPSFSLLSSKNSYLKSSSEEDSKETEESDKKDDYIFPWYRDREDKKRKRNRYRGKSIGEYEYPWDRRERLAREERKKREEKRRKYDSDEDDDIDDAFTIKHRRKAYPRGRIRFWTRRDEDSSEENDSDNIESSSENRPVMKYSSRYNSKSAKLPLDENATSVRSRIVEEIGRSSEIVLDGDFNDTSNSQEKNSGEMKAGHVNRGSSRGIVPEDVTMAPKRNGRKESRKSLLDESNETTNRNSSVSLKNILDKSQLAVATANSNENSNSTTLANKRRRRPPKNVSTTETTAKTDVNRGRRRQKTASSVTSASSTSTTSAPRVARRKQPKSVKDLKKNNLKIVDKKYTSEIKETEASMAKDRSMEHRLRAPEENHGGGKSPTNKESMKNTTDHELKEKDSRKDRLNKDNGSEEKNVHGQSSESESVETRDDFGDHDERKNVQTDKSTKTLNSVKDDDKKFDFKDDRIEALSDFDKSDGIPGEDDEFGFESILKSDTSFVPQNRAVQLSQQESREIISTKSWVSENYNF